jgi:hypothetical protein
MATIRRRVSHLAESWLAGTALLLGDGAAPVRAQRAQLDAVPEVFYGAWGHHGMNLTIRGGAFASEAPTVGRVSLAWRDFQAL